MNINPSLEGAGKNEEAPAFSDISSFLKAKQESLLKTPENLKHSNIIAFEIAKYLIKEGKNPEIRCIQAREIKGYRDTISFKKLPAMKVTSYSICVVEDTVFDPLYGEPISLPAYLGSAFTTTEVEEIVLYPKTRIEGIFNK